MIHSDSLMVSVLISFEDDRADFKIGFPPDQEKISVRDAAHILAGGISLLIKCCEKEDTGIKSHELIKQIHEHLDEEYVSITSYEDAKTDISFFKE